MNLKPTLMAAAFAAACGTLAIAPTALAADSGTITFNGQVLNSTCSVSGDGGSNDFTVALPTVQKGVLPSSGAYSAGAKPFTLSLTGCPVNATPIKVGAQFYSSNADAALTGGLKNASGTGYATGLDVQLLDSGNTAITIGTAAPTGNANVSDQVAVDGSGNATLGYTAQYYVTGTVGAGSVSTSVQYVINYQ
jgi:major type 1 subunit fimbrin (pilin)